MADLYASGAFCPKSWLCGPRQTYVGSMWYPCGFLKVLYNLSWILQGRVHTNKQNKIGGHGIHKGFDGIDLDFGRTFFRSYFGRKTRPTENIRTEKRPTAQAALSKVPCCSNGRPPGQGNTSHGETFHGPSCFV